MNDYIMKRDSLEIFLKEQLIGPGVLNKRFFFLDKWETNEFAGKSVGQAHALENYSEVITEVPAYIYGSGILFPETRLALGDAIPLTNEDIDTTIQDNEEETKNFGAEDEDLIGNDSENLISKQQNYPNSIGISFVVKGTTNIENAISVELSYRKYKNIKKDDAFKRRIAYWVSEYENEIEKAITQYFKPLFSTEWKDDNLFIFLGSKLTNEDLYAIDYKLLNKYVIENTVVRFRDVFKDRLVELKQKDGAVYYGISGDRSHEFYSITTSSKYGDNVVKIFNDRVIEYIKDELIQDIDNYILYKDLIKGVEIHGQLKKIVTDLKTIFKLRNASPVWECERYDSISLPLPEFSGPKSIFTKTGLSVKGEEDLKYSVQYIKRNDEIFIKVMLVNVGTVTIGRNEPMQLNKKDEANIKSYFGIQLDVSENIPNVLQQYNPPQMLDFDQEDNFNKLLYRNYKDYGEGYNTSVDWGLGPQGLRYLCTEFLPKQETPKIDFTPCKIVGKEVIPRLKDEGILSMRSLSTLSDLKDKEVLSGIRDFVTEYGLWIMEKGKALESEQGLKADQRLLLGRQLAACNRDVKRLERNIGLLEGDSAAMVAFRTMNTALFIQLHHGKGIDKANKEGKSAFTNFESNSDYYKTIDCIGNDYKWRSFQLAFILLNVDAFIRHEVDEDIVNDVFGTGWPERNDIADLVWFPTGGGKTEAYLGIIAFTIAYRRFTKKELSGGTTVLMRYTLRLLTLQQFQRATLLICALEMIRSKKFDLKGPYNLGEERITIGLFVGGGSLPNTWEGKNSMSSELDLIRAQIDINSKNGQKNPIKTLLPFNSCPWCGTELFINNNLDNILPIPAGKPYTLESQLYICCTSPYCAFSGRGLSNRPTETASLPILLFDEDIYKYPPTLLFGTVDKFAVLANKVSAQTGQRNQDSRRLLGKGAKHNTLPPELIIQDELHLLLGPLGSAVGLFEKGIDRLCTYFENGTEVRPKIITSTATTRNTDKQIFALFNRRSEIFPKQGITCDDSFFAYYERTVENEEKYLSNRKYVGILPVGKTQVWMQLRVASICLAHRLKYLKDNYSLDDILMDGKGQLQKEVLDYYHTVLSYFNSLKDVGKTQSQLSHYLPGDVTFVVNNTIPWSFLDKMIRKEGQIQYSELTGRLSGEQVKTNLSLIGKNWSLVNNRNDEWYSLNDNNPPEFVISTNMISVGIDISRFNTMIISSMPRNIAEYIQASSRVARSKEGIVFTVHHPFRSRDISHYQKFKEFHEKFYSYVEPISVTPFASKALDRYFAMLVSMLIRHTSSLGLTNNQDAGAITKEKVSSIKAILEMEIQSIAERALLLEDYLRMREFGILTTIDGIISNEEVKDMMIKLEELTQSWLDRLEQNGPILEYRSMDPGKSLFKSNTENGHPGSWKVGNSLREIDPSIVIKTVQQ